VSVWFYVIFMWVDLFLCYRGFERKCHEKFVLTFPPTLQHNTADIFVKESEWRLLILFMVDLYFCNR